MWTDQQARKRILTAVFICIGCDVGIRAATEEEVVANNVGDRGPEKSFSSLY